MLVAGQPLGRAAQWVSSFGCLPRPGNNSMRGMDSNGDAPGEAVVEIAGAVAADNASGEEGDGELAGSRLGRKEHWDQVYAEELTNLEEHGDEGELW